MATAKKRHATAPVNHLQVLPILPQEGVTDGETNTYYALLVYNKPERFKIVTHSTRSWLGFYSYYTRLTKAPIMTHYKLKAALS